MINHSGYYSHLNANALAKLKRLKIQESVLCTSINKSLLTLGQEGAKLIEIEALDDFKRYESSLCDLLCEIKNLFEDIKTNTNLENDVNELDIDEVKRDIFRLESKLSTFNSHIQTELRSLILRGKDINNMLYANPATQPMAKYKSAKASAKAFTDIVPSPVRILMNCPFKCPEVQSLQEFLKNSHGRCKGWNEYNHNIFVQIWNKHYAAENIEDLIKHNNCNKNSAQYERFREEVIKKIPGLTPEDIKSNYTWYTQLVYLKTRQQKALEKWKENKQKMKKREIKTKQKPPTCSSDSATNYSTNKLLHNTSKDMMQHDGNPPLTSYNFRERTKSASNFNKTKNSDLNCVIHLSGNLKRTEQRRRNSVEQWKPPPLLPITENKRQLRIPTWRLGLH